MSHWGATVITNLLSAIPFIGQDIVPFIATLPLDLKYIWPPYRKAIPDKRRALRLIYNYLEYSAKPIPYALRKELKTKFHTFNKTNRKSSHDLLLPINNIDKGLLALIIGFIDGDGYIRVTKNSKRGIDYIYSSLVPPASPGGTKAVRRYAAGL